MSTKELYPDKRIDRILKDFELLNDYYFYFSADYLDSVPGVYILWLGKRIKYIGQSDDIGRRLKGNHRVYDWKKGYVISAVPVYNGRQRKKIEKVLIKAIQPPRNRVFL